MKKKIRRISVFILLMLMGFGLIIRPNAKVENEDNYYVLELPTNNVDDVTIYYHYTVEDKLAYEILGDLLDSVSDSEDYTKGVLYNLEGDPILHYNLDGDKDETPSFSLYEGVAEDDLIIDIRDDEEFRDELVEEWGFDPFEGYTKVKLVLTEFEPFEVKDRTLKLDLTNIDNVRSMRSLDLSLMEEMIDKGFEHYNIKEYEKCNNLDGKTVVISNYVHDNDKGHWTYELADNLTSEDNIVIDKEDDPEAFNNFIDHLSNWYGINIEMDENQTKLVLKFAEDNYDDSYYVIDYTTNDNLATNYFARIWYCLRDDKYVEREEYLIDWYSGEELLFRLDWEDEFINFLSHKDFTLDDNEVFNVSEDETFQRILDRYDITGVDYLSFVFKKLELKPFDGEDEIKTEFTADESVKFRLNLDYQKHKDDLRITVDEKGLIKDQDYTLSEGSIIVTLTDELEIGEHTFSAYVENEGVTIPFTVIEANTIVNNEEEPKTTDKTETGTKTDEQKTDDTKTEETKTDDKKTETVLGTKASEEKVETTAKKDTTSNPKTLDNVFQMFGLLTVSAGGIYIACRKLKKTNN